MLVVVATVKTESDVGNARDNPTAQKQSTMIERRLESFKTFTFRLKHPQNAMHGNT